jgi:outer membrane protein assembly factor BamB
VVYVGSCNGLFRALDLRTGAVRWETKLSPDAEQYFFHGNPLVAGDIIVVGADRARGASIHAVDRLTGKALWKKPVGRGVMGPISGDSTHAYASTAEGQLTSLQVTSGAAQWTMDLQIPGFEGPAVSGNRVFAGASDGVHALNAESGREEWRVNLGAPVSTSVAVVQGDLYVGTRDGMIHRIDAGRGTTTASRQLDPMLMPQSVPVRTPNAVLVLLADQTGDYRALVSLDHSLSGVQWRVDAEKLWKTSRVFVWGDVVVLGTLSGDVTAYCEKTGVLAWSRSVKGSVRAIGGAEDILLVGTQSGDLYALHAPRTCDVT